MMKRYMMKWSNQKQPSALPKQTSHIFGNAFSCCFYVMRCCLCQETRTELVGSNPNIFLCVFRDAAGQRYWDAVPLRHLRPHQAATRGRFGLQRALPEGTPINLFSFTSLLLPLALRWLSFPAFPSAARRLFGLQQKRDACHIFIYQYAFQVAHETCSHSPPLELAPAETSAPPSHQRGLLP